MPGKLSLLSFALVVFAAPVSAKINAGITPIFGDEEYSGTEVYAAASFAGFSIAPEWKSYKDKNVSGRINTLQGRLGYDMRWVGVGATAGSTLKKNGYSTTFGGADFSFTISPMGDKHIRRIGGAGRGGAPVGKGLARVDFGGGALVTKHEQEVFGTVTTASDLTATEYHGFVGASVLKILLSGRLAQYAYSKDLKTLTAVPSGAWTPVAGHLNYNSGYADRTLNLRAEMPIFPMVSPFASWTTTRFAEFSTGRPGDQQAIELGVNVGLEMLAVRASYQRITVTGGPDRDFTSIGASLRL